MASPEELAGLLRDSVKASISDSSHINLMFSGGVDSAILAVIARKYCDVTLYVSGLEGSNDIAWGTECGSILDLPINQIVFTEEDVIQSMKNVVLVHKMKNPRWMSTFTAFDIVLSRLDSSQVFCGQGADELFGGYKKYREMEPDAAIDRMRTDYDELANDELPVYCSMAAHYGSELVAPYLRKEVVEYAGTVPIDMKLGTENKQILRDAARILGVPNSMASRPKKAMQYGSGVSKIIKSHIKSKDIDLSGIIDSINEIGNLYE